MHDLRSSHFLPSIVLLIFWHTTFDLQPGNDNRASSDWSVLIRRMNDKVHLERSGAATTRLTSAQQYEKEGIAATSTSLI